MTTLLLVDDDDFMRSALSRALNRTGGFTVLPAEHGRRALDVLAEQQVDAILTDLEMPVMDGLTLLAELFEQEIRLPVAVMTGQAIHTPLRQRLLAYGIAAIFSKPVDVVVLADELQRVLDPKAVGRISGITLFGFLQLLEVERKSGLVVVAASDHEGRLYFDDGQLVHAHTGHLEGLAAAYEVLSWPEPAVEIFYKRRARERTVDAPLQHVLMEGARLLDERGRGTGEPGRHPRRNVHAAAGWTYAPCGFWTRRGRSTARSALPSWTPKPGWCWLRLEKSRQRWPKSWSWRHCGARTPGSSMIRSRISCSRSASSTT